MTIECRYKISRPNFVLDVDLLIPSSGVTAIFGASGSGKTTFLRAIAGLEKSRGFIKVGGIVWEDEKYLIPTHQRSIGYVFQESSLFEHLSVKDNIEYGYKRSKNADHSVMQRAIELLQIGHLLNRSIGQLSGGECQRVAIARALSVGPELLLMDEPLASLGEQHKKEILPFLDLLHAELNIPIIYVSHSLDEVTHLADQLVLLDDGKVISNGPTAEILTQLDLSIAHGERAASLIEAKVAEHDSHYNLTYLDFSGGRLTVPRRLLGIGSDVRVRVEARDVSLTTVPQIETSILNVLPCVVDEIVDEGDAQVMVRLKLNQGFLLSRVTKKSAELLRLKPGKEIFAQIKSVAVLF